MGYQLELYSVSWATLEEEMGTIRVKKTASPKSRTATEEEANALIDLVREHGEFLGSLDHASASAEEFLDGFMGKVLKKCFPKAKLATLLMDRPMFGLKPNILPSWGGLAIAEIDRALKQYVEPKEEDVEGDYAGWLADLVDFLEWAKERQNDLVSLYL